MRRAHKKSRYGCKECKQKHKRCDETRPSCINCVTFEQRCSYLDSVARPSPGVALPSPASSTAISGPQEVAPSPLKPSQSGLGERYSLLHLELLRDYDDLG